MISGSVEAIMALGVLVLAICALAFLCLLLYEKTPLGSYLHKKISSDIHDDKK